MSSPDPFFTDPFFTSIEKKERYDWTKDVFQSKETEKASFSEAFGL